jgi:hypothetical protein
MTKPALSLAAMPGRRAAAADFFVGNIVGALLLAVLVPALGHAAFERPRLVVVVAVDQLPRELLDRFAPLFAEGGFRRLTDGGADFDQCRHEHSPTLTAPGHAVMLTGAYPRQSGIVGNRWYARSEAREVGAVDDERFPLVGTNGAPPAGAGVSPLRLLADTVGDVLRTATVARAKVVSASIKERSAVLLGGRRPSGAYWFDAAGCRFVTSTYYASALPAWVERFNASGPCAPHIGEWRKLRADIDYADFATADDRPYEAGLFGLGRTFPHPVRELDPSGPPEEIKRYDAVAAAPSGNDLLARFARAAIEAEGLGADLVPDVLALSFSSNDAIGHLYGPNSQEVLDVTLRTDRQLAELMGDLDRAVGKERWLLALTSDHGASPVPDYLEEIGVLPARPDHYRFDVRAARAEVERRLMARFFGNEGPPPGCGGFFASFAPRTMPFVYLDPRAVACLPRGTSQGDLLAAAAEEIAALDGVARVYRGDSLAPADDDPFVRAAARGWHAANGGDLALQLRPYWLVGPTVYASSHGSPYAYDTHVPMLLYGAGIKAGRFHRPVAVADLAATLAQLLGVSPPPYNEGRPLGEALD